MGAGGQHDDHFAWFAGVVGVAAIDGWGFGEDMADG